MSNRVHFSIFISLQTNESYNLKQAIVSPDHCFIQPSASWIEATCIKFGLYGLCTNAFEPIPTSIIQMIPGKTAQITKDGNCLFSTFSYLLTSSQQSSKYIRNIICNQFDSVPFTMDQINAHTDRQCETKSSYITLSNMWNRGEWGGDIEVAAFSFIFQTNIVVYSDITQTWFEYKSFLTNPSPSLLIHHQTNHWEPIISLKHRHNYGEHLSKTNDYNVIVVEKSYRELPNKIINSTIAINSSSQNQNSEDSIRLKRKKAFNVSIANKSRHVNLNVFNIFREPDNSKLFTENADKCAKCNRHSTEWYPLNTNNISLTDCITRRYGNLLKNETFTVCDLCFNYLSLKGDEWCNAWPSVLFTYFFDHKKLPQHDLISLLPNQICASWFSLDQLNNDYSYKVMNDLTHDEIIFNGLLKTYKAAHYKIAMNMYPFPSTKCFCGATEFVETCGQIGFNHFLNYLDETFKSFKSNWRLKLKSIRTDFLDVSSDLLPIEIKPAVKLSKKGLALCTCKNHDNGSKLNMCHVPKHPTTKNISHPHSDRLAALTTTLRGATPVKVGEFSTTWTMSKSIGGIKGVGSLCVHDYRNMSVKSDYLLPSLESCFLHNRFDCSEVMQNLALEYHMDEDLINKFYSQNNVPLNDQLFKCLKSATYIPMSLTYSIKKYLETFRDTNPNFKGLYIDHQFYEPCSSNLSQLPLTCFKIDYHLSLVMFLVMNITSLKESFFQKDYKLLAYLNELIKTKGTRSMYAETLKQVRLKLGIKTSSCFKTFWQEIAKNFTDWNIINHTESDVYHMNSNILICVSNRKSDNLCPLFYQDNFQLAAQENVPLYSVKNLVLFNYLPSESTYFYCTGDGSTSAEVTLNKEKMEERCRLKVYIRKPKPPTGVMNFFSGQDYIKCPIHEVPLCTDFVGTFFLCGAKTCKLKSKWRCPQKMCTISLCKKHFASAEVDNSVLDQSDNSCSFEFEDESQSQEIIKDDEVSCFYNDEVYDGPSSSNDIDEIFMCDTDAGLKLTEIEYKPKTDLNSAPIQVLFNSFMSLLHRPITCMSSNLLQKRYFQSFVAKHERASLSLLQLEGLLFPSIFYKQLTDGSSLGALPFFLYCSNKECQQYGFAGLLQHFQTRITDISLQTSSNIKYIQYMTDCLINLNLSGKHSKEYFQRGLQSLTINNKKPRLFNEISFSLNDNDKCVKQLAASLRRSCVNFFLTLTCNQKNHPGVAPIMKAVNDFYFSASEEIKKEVKTTYMSMVVRCWSRSIKYLINLILHSSENLIGKVEKIWGRAEFQTTVGNLPHYHVLLWVNPNSYDENIIQCSEQTIFQEFQNICNSSMELIHENEKIPMYEECLKIHTHDCEKSGYRCHKRKDLEGNKVCRTPANPSSHHHWLLSIQQNYPDIVKSILIDISLAKEDEINGFLMNDEMACEKYMYAAANGEHILPTNTKLFCITRSSTNLLFTTGQFSCNYLTWYATKSEEHADAKITSGTDGKNFRLRDDGIQNKRLASVKFLLDYERKNKRQVQNVSCQMLSITESVFWLLGEPYVFTNMIFVHVQNVPSEQRFVKSSKRLSKPSENLNKFNFRNHVPDLPNFRKITASQKQILNDSLQCDETIDNMSKFNLRPPELLIISNVEQFYRCFVSVKLKHKLTDLIHIFKMRQKVPWISCLGNNVLLRKSAVDEVKQFLEFHLPSSQNNQKKLLGYERYNNFKNVLQSDSFDSYLYHEDASRLLPEIVFRSVAPTDTITFLISFLLRFGYFETELDLFHSTKLVDSYVHAGLISFKIAYNERDVLMLLKKYIQEELRFEPGGILTKSSKILSAKDAFSILLNVENKDALVTPLVLIEDIQFKNLKSVEDYFCHTQLKMFERVRQLGLENLPEDIKNFNEYWLPEFRKGLDQDEESFLEQRTTLKKIIGTLNNKFGAISRTHTKHQVILGKTYLK